MNNKITPTRDTIVALATPPGRSGISVIRISGAKVQGLFSHLFKKHLKPRYATVTSFYDVKDEPIDQGVALFFEGPHSFTGEDVLEFQGHGSPAVIELLLQRILSLNIRMARPGEFSERAFLNHKIDLLQAEAIADLIHASSEKAARSAMRSLQGEFSKSIQKILEKLIHLRMHVEASIDFAEEEIDFLADPHIQNQLLVLIHDVQSVLHLAKQGSVLREGLNIVILGRPNVGKSSLLNRLSQRDSAIVTEIPGTTRDLLRESLVIDGLPIHIVDTAGLRESSDVVEQEGIRRAHAEVGQSDLIMWMIDSEEDLLLDWNEFIKHRHEKSSVILIRNKIDLTKQLSGIVQKDEHEIIYLSVKTGEGIELLKEKIKQCAGIGGESEGVFSARRRHIDALVRVETLLQKGLEQLLHYRAGECLAEELRQAQQMLGEITGLFTSDDLLGHIFSNFCIGK